jgi:hypothetical protein
MSGAPGTEKVYATSKAAQQRVFEGKIHPGKDLRTMHKQMMGLVFMIAAFAVSAAAQTNTFPPSGNVGIGTTSPVYLLDLSAPTSTSGMFRIGSANTPANSGYLTIGGYTYAGYSPVFQGASFRNTFPDFAFLATGNNDSGNREYIELSTQATVANRPILAVRNGNYNGPVLFLVNANGNVGIGTTNPARKLEIAGDVQIDGALYFGSNATAQSLPFAGISCTGADYAEAIDVTGDRTKYEPGDVLVIDPSAPGKFLKASQAYSTLVAGIYSTKPGFVGRKQPPTPETSATEVPMAMVGRVPAKVTAENGPIKVGDLLVASSTSGRAMKGTDRSLLTGAVIGKALGSLDSGTGVIEVLVTLQ